MKVINRSLGNKTYTVEMTFEEMFNLCKEIGVSDSANAPKKDDVVHLESLFRQKKDLLEEIYKLNKKLTDKTEKKQLNG